MTKIKKKSINEIMDIYRNSKNNVILTLTNPDDNSVVMEVSIKNSMTIEEKGIFVDRVANACFDENGDFMPQYIDPVFVITLLQMTTNIPVFEKSILSNDNGGDESAESFSIVDIEKTYDLCKAVDLKRNVEDERYQALILELKNMVDDKLAYKKAMNIRKSSDLLNVLKTVTESIEKVTEGMSAQEILDKLDNVIGKIPSAENNVS